MLYAEAQSGSAAVPWDDRQANPHLAEWAAGAAERAVVRPGRQALVVGCGVCDDPVFDPAIMLSPSETGTTPGETQGTWEEPGNR